MKKILILAGGNSLRFGSQKPKQFHVIKKKMMIDFVIEACLSVVPASQIYIVCNKEWINYFSKKSGTEFHIVPGGKSRIESTLKGLNSMNCQNEDFIYLLESNRPLLKRTWLTKLYSTLKKEEGKDVAIYRHPITESLFQKTKDEFLSIPKGDFFVGQTPYLFKGSAVRKLLTNTYENVTDSLDLVSVLDNKNILTIESNFNNIKVTTKKDFQVVSSILQ